MSVPRPIPRNRPLEPQDLGLPRRSPPMPIPGVPRERPRPMITRDRRRPGVLELTLPDLASPSDHDPANRPYGPGNNIANGSPVPRSHRLSLAHSAAPVSAIPPGGLPAEIANRLPANIIAGVGVPPSHRRRSPGNTAAPISVAPGFVADVVNIARASGMELPAEVNNPSFHPQVWEDIVRVANFNVLHGIRGTSKFGRDVAERVLPFRHIILELIRTMATADDDETQAQSLEDDQVTITPRNFATPENPDTAQFDGENWTLVSPPDSERSSSPAGSSQWDSDDDDAETLHLSPITGATLEFHIKSTHYPNSGFTTWKRLGLAPLPRQFVTRDLEEGLKWVQTISEHVHAVDIVLPAHVAANWESTRWGGSFVQAWQEFTNKAAELKLFANVKTVRLSSDLVRVPLATFPKLTKIVRHSATDGNPGRDVPIPGVNRLIDIVKYTCFDSVRPDDTKYTEPFSTSGVIDETTRLLSRRSMDRTDVVVIINLLPNHIVPASREVWEATLLTYLTAYLAAVKSLTIVINDQFSLPPSPEWNYPHTNRHFARAFWARRWVFINWRNGLPSRLRHKVRVQDYDQYHNRVGAITCEFEDIMTAF